MDVRVLGVGGGFVAATLVLAACTAPSPRSGFETQKDETVAAPGAGDDTGGGFAQTDAGTASSCAINNTSGDLDKDYDGDGYPLRYDCNECDPNTNAGAKDIAGNGLDEDCSGTPDDEEEDCDTGLSMAASDPFDAAKAMGLCKKADPTGKEWGVVEAKWVQPDGTSLTEMEGVGVLPKFGVNLPQMGSAMLALSSGTARAPNDPDFKNPSGDSKGNKHGTPTGYPKESPACPGVTSGAAQDGAALQIKVRVPSNAHSFSYQQNFFTYEYSTWICSKYNDFFVTMMDPAPPNLPDGNIAFDQDKNPISVNNSLLQVCSPGTFKGKAFACPLGTSTLKDTGFERHAATGWLTTKTDVEPGAEITLMFAIWDSGDGLLDSTVLIDDFQWSAEEGNGTSTAPSSPK